MRAETQKKLEETEVARAALEAWKEEHVAWEAQTKSNFLDMEDELREAKAALEEALDGREKAALEAKLEETRAALEDDGATDAGRGGRSRRCGTLAR